MGHKEVAIFPFYALARHSFPISFSLPTPILPFAENQKKEKALGSCELCFESDRFKKHLLLSLGDKICLLLPERGSLCDGHCLLVPTRHIAGSRMLDEDEYDELRMFQRCLVDMFAEQDKDVVFLESVMGLSRHPHSAIHCVPLSRDDGAMAPMFFKVGVGGNHSTTAGAFPKKGQYFDPVIKSIIFLSRPQKAILESDTQWAQNKRLIDTKEKGLRRSVRCTEVTRVVVCHLKRCL
jgi:diadenosine tetraphosphate (Ap4A) HIT family hydrolase